jgi:hypothetical protein
MYCAACKVLNAMCHAADMLRIAHFAWQLMPVTGAERKFWHSYSSFERSFEWPLLANCMMTTVGLVPFLK